MGEGLLKFWRWLQNAAQQAAVAEAPAVMTAAGQKINRNTRKVEYNHQNDKGVKQLRSNLADIGEAGATAPGAAKAIETGYNIVRHPKKTYQAAKELRNLVFGKMKSAKPVKVKSRNGQYTELSNTQSSIQEQFGNNKGTSRTSIYKLPYRREFDEGFNIVHVPADRPEQTGFMFAGKNADTPMIRDINGKWVNNSKVLQDGRFTDPIDGDIVVGRRFVTEPQDVLYHYDTGNYPVYFNEQGLPMLKRVPYNNMPEELGPIWWNQNSIWGGRALSPRIIKVPDYVGFRTGLKGSNIGDANAILTTDYPLQDATFLQREDMLNTYAKGIFARQSKPQAVPTAQWPTLNSN